MDLSKKQPLIKMLKFDLKINQKELVDKSDIANLVKNAELDKKSSNISNKSKIKSITR